MLKRKKKSGNEYGKFGRMKQQIDHRIKLITAALKVGFSTRPLNLLTK